MDDIWQKLPSDLRDSIRQRAPPQVWSAMNRAEPTAARRQVSDMTPAFLQRVSNLMAEQEGQAPLDLHEPVSISMRGEYTIISCIAGMFFLTSTGRADTTGTRQEVLSRLTPMIRRAAEQQLHVRLEQGSTSVPTPPVAFESPSFRLAPQYAYLATFHAPPPDAKSAFLQRLALMLAFLKSCKIMVRYYETTGYRIRVSNQRLGEHRVIESIPLRPDFDVSTLDDDDDDDLDYEPPQVLDEQGVLRKFGDAHEADTRLAMSLTSWVNTKDIQKFHPPSYNPVRHPGWL